MKIKLNRSLSNTKLKIRVKRKTNPLVNETINLANKNEDWKSLARVLSGPSRKFSAVNLRTIDLNTKAGDTVLIPGKVLSSGDLTKKVRIVSLSISRDARDKLAKTKSEHASILDEIKINKKAEGIKILR